MKLSHDELLMAFCDLLKCGGYVPLHKIAFKNYTEIDIIDDARYPTSIYEIKESTTKAKYKQMRRQIKMFKKMYDREPKYYIVSNYGIKRYK